ncbi:hypothetical protein [Streptomyces sp. NPDC056683]|uniref:hypothetical protein n=1 Tax=Streptomyces sp. NPDC056683 TaxID=3345910 RepID=UPI0036990157
MQQQGVGLHGGQVPAVGVAESFAAVGADDQDVLAAGRGFGPVVAERGTDVGALDVAVEMGVDPAADGGRAEHQDRDAERDPPADTTLGASSAPGRFVRESC